MNSREETRRRPAPVPSTEAAPYWEGAAQGRLRLQSCLRCDAYCFPPAARCANCLSDALAWRDLTGNGILRSWTALFLSAFAGASRPTLIAEVEPEEARTIMIPMLASIDESRLFIDMPVLIRFEQDANGWSFPIAEPRASG
jgi:uncharacterized OB-fold protein